MIFTERTITVVNDSATINKPLILYRGDKNIELKITIAESQFKFRNTDASNVIETTDASYAQLVINTPYNSPIFSDVAATKNGAVIFVITEAMIDEIREVGAYEIQIRLLDDNKQSRASIPPVSNAIEIREPIAIEDGSPVDSNAVNTARVNRALTTTSAPLEVFDSQGNYIKNIWGDGDPITDAALNKMEAGIDGINKKIANVNNINDTTASATTTYSSNKIENIKEDLSSQIRDIVIDSGNITFRDVTSGEIFTVKANSGSPDLPPTENVDITGITLNNHTLSIENGKTKTLIATVSPSNATNKNVTWSATNSNVTIVPNGLQCSITGASTGSCQVTVTTEQGSFLDSCDISITEVVATDYIKDNLIVDLDMTNIRAEDAVITDKSGAGNNFTIVTPVASSAEGYWYPGDSNGAYCTNLITLGTDDFTLEIYCSMNISHNSPYVALGTATWSNKQTNLCLSPYGSAPVPPLVLTLGLGKDNYYPQFDLSSYVSLNSFAYITIVKQSNKFTCYVDGELTTTFTSEKALDFISSPLSINCMVDDNLGTGLSRTNSSGKYKLFRLYKGKTFTADEVRTNYNMSKTIGGN